MLKQDGLRSYGDAKLILDLKEGNVKFCRWSIRDLESSEPLIILDNVPRGKDIKYKFAAKCRYARDCVVIDSFEIE